MKTFLIMKVLNRNIVKSVFSVLGLVAVALLPACFPDEVTGDLGKPPEAVLGAIVQADGYSVTLSNDTKTPTIAYYSIPALNLGFSDLTGESVDVGFIFPGTYEVKMLVTGHNGIDSAKVMVTTTEPDPTACDPATALGFIASCTSKTWRLLQDAGAYKVGPGPQDGSWWTSGAGDVTGRACEFHDEYTFYFDANGTFEYESFDDFYGDGYLGDNSSTCQPENNFTAVQEPWGSGTHKFAVIKGTGQAGLGQLKVIGLGAHIGLQKVTTNAEITDGPVSSITYDILSMTEDVTGDVIVIGANMGWGWWTFTLKEKI
jgi:hypothetical protein